MPEAISNTSPLLYLYRIGALDWLPKIFSQVWTAEAVVRELDEGGKLGHHVPFLQTFAWLKIGSPRVVPSQWLSLDEKSRISPASAQTSTCPKNSRPIDCGTYILCCPNGAFCVCGP